MKKILFVSALAAELKIVKEEIKKLNSNDFEFSFLEGGMGNYNMIFNLTKYLEKNNDFDFIVNIGVCGYREEYKELIQVGRIKNLSNLKEKIVPNFINLADIESILSSEQIISDEKVLKNLEEKFVDMESFGFEIVVEKYNLARIILKVPVDKVGIETKNFDFKKVKKYLKENIDYGKLVEKIKNFLKNILPNPSPLEERELIIKNEILNYYKWTFSEKVILEKQLNKFLALKLGNLEDFFEENKSLGKKEFLNKLRNIN